MASNINPYNIDGTFPVAGQDNDSQGFRDNFTNTSNNFSTAATEITDLQSKALLKSALTGSTLNNNMGGTGLTNLTLNQLGYTLNNQGTVSGAVTLDLSTGNFQKVTLGGSITVGFTNWPTSGIYAKMQVIFVVSNIANTVTVGITSPGVTGGLSQIPGANTATGVISFDEPGTYSLEFSSSDAGQNIYVNNIGRNHTTFRGSNFYYNPDISSTFLVGYGSGLSYALAAEQGQDIISAAGSYNSASVGNLTLANIINPATDIGGLAGYSVTSARGNLQTSTVSPVQSNDILGYVNSIAMTGNGAGNVFQQVSSIGFYATGSNVVYGLGGNIAFFTADDGGNTTNKVFQAVGIENDQSTRMFANLMLSATSSGGSGTSSYVPAHNTSVGTTGQVAWDQTYVYVCTATNTWKRIGYTSTSW